MPSYLRHLSVSSLDIDAWRGCHSLTATSNCPPTSVQPPVVTLSKSAEIRRGFIRPLRLALLTTPFLQL